MDNVYSTTDIILAAVLKVKGYKLQNIDVRGNKGTFNFEDVPESIVLEYDLGSLQVEPVSFNNAIKALTTSCRRMSDAKGFARK